MPDPLPIAASEDVQRGISAASRHYDPASPIPISPYAFKPRPVDTDGISVFRRELVEPQLVAAFLGNGKPTYVALISVEELFLYHFRVVPFEINELPGHAVIPNLFYQKLPEAHLLEQMDLLARKLVKAVLGPF